MRAIDLEAKVITAVERIRAAQLVEHDFMECKRSWPQDDKARQLAGSLNRAGGDPVIYIIGIDDRSGEVFDISDTDVLDWWEQIKPKFDQTPPEMVRHMSVPVGENGEHVVAVAFASDRGPYLVKTGRANSSLEVPMREGTGTRSARRDELLRILIPTVKVPSAVVLSARLDATFYPAQQTSGDRVDKPNLSCRGQVKLYFEHSGRELVTLPAHGMRGTAMIGEKSREIKIVPDTYHSDDQKMRPQFGVVRTPEAIVVSGPAAASLHLIMDDLPLRDRKQIAETTDIPIELDLEVLDGARPLRVSVILEKARLRPYQMSDPNRLGSWSFKHPNLPGL